MNYLAKWRGACGKYKLLNFLDIILKGYGQVLLCLSPLTGLSLAAAILFLSRTIFLLTLLGVLSSTITAFMIRARDLHINAGVYGFNGVILGIAWLWFLRLNTASVILLIIFASLSSLITRSLIYLSSRIRTNLPFFSIPSLILVWSIIALSLNRFPHQGLVGPDERIIGYLCIYKANFTALCGNFSPGAFIKTFYKQIIAVLIIFLGIRLHSRITARVCSTSFFVTIVMVYCLGGALEFKGLEFYLYNAIPCGIALGGTCLVFNRKVFLFTMLGVMLVAWLTFIGGRHFWLPVFIAPFNLVTISFLWLIKRNLLKRRQGFYAVPMELISTPEFGLEWYKGELYADDYWRKVEDSYQEKV